MSMVHRLVAGSALAAGLLGAFGCQADYAADVTNKTAVPLTVALVSRASIGPVSQASKRLGPGDRAFLGPIRNARGRGAYIVFDTLPNPGRPTTVELLADSTSYFEVRLDGDRNDAPLIVIPK